MRRLPPRNFSMPPGLAADLEVDRDQFGDEAFRGLTHNESVSLIYECKRLNTLPGEKTRDDMFVLNELWIRLQVGRSISPIRVLGSPSISYDPPSLSEATKERIKLQAEFLSGLGSNLIATGTFGSIGAFILANTLAGWQSFLIAAFGIFCFFAGFALHFIASMGLRTLDQ